MENRKPGRPRKQRNPTEEGIAAELAGLLGEITEDGKVSDEEALQLRDWLAANQASRLPSVAFLRTVVDQILADGQVTETERRTLHMAIEKALPVELRQQAKAHRTAVELVEKERAKLERLEERRRREPVLRLDFGVRGVLHEDRAEVVDSELTAGQTVLLVREPENTHDSNAISVCLEGGSQIGYVPREEARAAAKLLDLGFKHVAYCKKIYQGSLAPVPIVCAEIFEPDTTVKEAVSASVARPPAARGSGCVGCLGVLGGLLVVFLFMLFYRMR
jgi:hypothetical protein